MSSTTTEAPLPAWSGIQRPQRADARRNFDALLTAARDAFAEHGTDASLEDIARRAGVGIGTLYRNFPTRDALIEAVYVAEVEKFVAATHAAGDLGPWPAIERWAQNFLAFVGTKKVLMASLNSESNTLLSCRTAMYSAGDPLVARAQDAGEMRQDVTVQDVIRLISGVAGAAYTDDAQRDRVIGLALDGLRAR